MTDSQIQTIIARHERELRQGTFYFPVACWMGALALGLLAFGLLTPLWGLFVFVVLALASWSVTADARKQLELYAQGKARLTWEALGRGQVFGTRLSDATRRLGNDVQKIYNGDPTGKLFPLRQSIRLVDAHHRQQQRLAIVEERLGELRGLQENLASKMAQLRELGEDYPQGAHNLQQINEDLEALRRVHGQIRASCTRLEAIVIGVQKAVQSRQLRAELEGLSARVAPSSGALEPAFAAESLEEIERQIGREIETYLRLERETEEHLR